MCQHAIETEYVGILPGLEAGKAREAEVKHGG